MKIYGDFESSEWLSCLCSLLDPLEWCLYFKYMVESHHSTCHLGVRSWLRIAYEPCHPPLKYKGPINWSNHTRPTITPYNMNGSSSSSSAPNVTQMRSWFTQSCKWWGPLVWPFSGVVAPTFVGSLAVCPTTCN